MLDLREVTASCVRSQEDAIASSGHIVQLDLSASPVLVLGDKLRLEQVACNLLTNAFKYSPAGAHVGWGSRPPTAERSSRCPTTG